MSRSFAADFIKASSILGVVFIHGSGLLGSNSIFNEYVAAFFRFGVPSFIILWAYFFEISYQKKEKKQRIKYIKGRLLHLFIIYAFWSTIYFLNLVNWQELTLKKAITMHFSGYGFAGQYFFIILFQLLLLYPFLRYLYSRKIYRNTLLFIVVGLYVLFGYFENIIPSLFLKLGDRPFIFWLPYVFCGIFLSRATNLKIPIVFSFAVFLIPVEFFVLKKLNLSHSAYISPMVLISTLLTCTSLLQNKIAVTNQFFVKLVSYIGKNTMTIFVTNPLVILAFSLLIPIDATCVYSNVQKITLPIVSTIFVLAFCLFVEKVIEKVRLKGIIN